MTVNEFLNYWEEHYPEASPLSYLLKTTYSNRWFRIHSLPHSKRYADNSEEYEIILQRQNRLFRDLFGEGEEMACMFSIGKEDLMFPTYKNRLSFDEFTHVYDVEIKEDYSECDSDVWRVDVYVKMDKWASGKWDDILKSIADDEIQLTFICPSTNCIIAPYDGGVDVIAESTEQRDQLVMVYRDWLSTHEKGL